jgi:ATP-dependent protease ClpP protease subunit
MHNSLLLEHGISLDRRELYLSGEVDVLMYHKARIAAEMFRNTGPFLVLLNSEGGDVYHALAIYEMFTAEGVEVDVHAVGACMSCGIVILQAGKHRTSGPMTTFMVHFGQETNESGSEAKSNAHLNKLMKQILQKRTGRTMRAVSKWMLADTYFTADEALKAGLLDGLNG